MKKITIDELRRLNYTEGLVLQAGTGGDPGKFAAVIHDLLTKEGVLLEGDVFKNVSVFEHDGKDHLYFSLEKVKLDWNQLNLWRLQSQGFFHGEWLSEFVPNHLGDFIIEKEKPDCPLIGQDGNIFNLMGIAARTLKQNGMKEEAAEMQKRITESGSYDNALCIIGEYVNITSVDDDEEYDEDMDDEYYDDEDEDQGMGGIT